MHPGCLAVGKGSSSFILVQLKLVSHMYAYLVVRPYGFLRLVRLLTLLTLATPTIVCSPRFHICIWQSRMGFDQFDGSSLWRCQVSAARNRRGPVLLAASWPKAMAFGTMDPLSQSEEANCEQPPSAFVDWEPMSWPNKIDSSATLPCSWVWRHQPLGFRLVRWKEASGAEVVCTCSSSSQQKLPHNKKNMTFIDLWNHPAVCQGTLLAPNNRIWNATPSYIGIIKLRSCHSLFPRTLSFPISPLEFEFAEKLKFWWNLKYYCFRTQVLRHQKTCRQDSLHFIWTKPRYLAGEHTHATVKSERYCSWFRNPADQLIGSLSHYSQGFIHSGGAGFLPSTVFTPTIIFWASHSQRNSFCRVSCFCGKWNKHILNYITSVCVISYDKRYVIIFLNTVSKIFKCIPASYCD